MSDSELKLPSEFVMLLSGFLFGLGIGMVMGVYWL